VSSTFTTPHLLDASNVGDLEDWGPLEEATGTEMHTSGVTLWEDGDSSAVAVFPKGWSGTWDIHEKVRKVYAIF
jgi:hypothetical protein